MLRYGIARKAAIAAKTKTAAIYSGDGKAHGEQNNATYK
jgi:hypothetical protein